ncbi:Nucleoside-diphosphate-sugar epimerase [Abditibacterium utsteinense]|uniref:Nucleoside-diphosphate-sugar epimerase n=1 Tax=Abditibacterium utsteinense TaxID=1960156 RepID=A0A2S8SUM2_9BACT|nr:NAD(P)-dependent oxidoreductase [Abditibacterium utsteinense]PQV64495.1 Nucleoside-diphosphate-sugar epimerase [Abditibacterium utsteinense]
MAHSFSATPTGALSQSNPTRRRVLVTGAAGNIGSFFARHSHQKYDLRLMTQQIDEKSRAIAGFGEIVTGDLSDLEKLKACCAGMDTVLHLAGNPSPNQNWESVLENNIIGTYNIMVAARFAGCRRVVYASSIHAVSGYPADVQVKTSEPVNPGDLYGVSKCFGEALGRYMAEQEGLSVLALRIGAFQPPSTAQKPSLKFMHAWVSQRDLNQLIEKSIDVEGLKFAIVHGLSDNHFKRLDISDARELLGYAPEDDFARENPLLQNLNLGELETSSVRDAGAKSGLRDELKGN